jgi:hypothetical protein
MTGPLELILREKIIAIIDDQQPYRLKRRDYDEEFAKAHGLSLDQIVTKSFVPCLNCGKDISTGILMGKFRVRESVFCSKECRTTLGYLRMSKITPSVDVNGFAKRLIACCMDIDLQAPIKRTRKGAPLETATLLRETNSLLRDIIKELRDGNRRP